MGPGDHHVYLIPGFFGFANFGDLKYFAHVREVFGSALEAYGMSVQMHYVATRPTASLQRRARRLLDVIAETAGDGGPVHLIGHSSGGLDARLLASPGVELGPGIAVEPIAQRVASVVTVGTPHAGTPLARMFATPTGAQLLRLLSILSVYVVRNGPVPLKVAVRLANALRRGAKDAGVFEQLYRQVLSEFTPERQAALTAFFADVSTDQSLIEQLAPEQTIPMFARLPDHPTARMGSVVLRTRPPALETILQLGFDAYAQAMHGLFAWLHRQNAAGTWDLPIAEAHEAMLRRAFGELPPALANDAIVPTRSQAWQTLVHATWADHLDAIGHFHAPRTTPPHYDWIPSGSRFSLAGFSALWNDVARFIAGDGHEPKSRP